MSSTKQNGRIWTEDDVCELLAMIQSNVSLEERATSLNRSTNAVENKLRKIAVDHVIDAGKSLEDTSLLTGIPESVIDEHVQKKLQFGSHAKQRANNVRPAKSKDVLWRLHEQLSSISEIVLRIESLLSSRSIDTSWAE